MRWAERTAGSLEQQHFCSGVTQARCFRLDSFPGICMSRRSRRCQIGLPWATARFLLGSSNRTSRCDKPDTPMPVHRGWPAECPSLHDRMVTTMTLVTVDLPMCELRHEFRLPARQCAIVQDARSQQASSTSAHRPISSCTIGQSSMARITTVVRPSASTASHSRHVHIRGLR